jgi:glycosyltransferase involved in cell wall biosynthesis
VKIALVSPRYEPVVGGLVTHVAELAKRIGAAGHQVEVLTQEHRSSELPAVETVDGIVIRRFAILGTGDRHPQAPGLWRWLAGTSATYDLMHAHCYHATPALAAALTGGRPLVVTPHYHGSGHTRLSRVAHVPYRLAGHRIFSRADRVICVSEAEATLVRRRFPRSAARITVIPCGVDSDELRGATPFTADGTIVLSAGRLAPYKHVSSVLPALRLLPDDFRFVVAGDGPAHRQLARMADRYGLVHRTTLLGTIPRDELCRWFRTASVFVTLSDHEAFGISLLEALVAGSSVVASDIPAHREVAALAAPGAVQLISERDGPAKLAEAIARAARTAVGPVATVPTWDAIAESTMALYESLVDRPRPAPSEFAGDAPGPRDEVGRGC